MAYVNQERKQELVKLAKAVLTREPGMEYPTGFDHSTMHNKPICGVLATALCAGVSYPVAHAACKAALLKLYPHRKRFGGGTYFSQRQMALSRLGVRTTEMSPTSPITLSNWIRSGYGQPGVMYMIDVPGHTITLKDGLVTDQGKLAKHHTDCRTGRRQVRRVLRIDGKGW